MTSAELQRAINSLKKDGGMGADQWSAAAMQALPQDAIEELAALLAQCEKEASWPQHMLHTWYALLVKNDAANKPWGRETHRPTTHDLPNVGESEASGTHVMVREARRALGRSSGRLVGATSGIIDEGTGRVRD